MKRMAKLAGFVLLGWLVTVVIYWLFLGMLEAYRSRSGGSPEVFMLLSFSISLPVALFFGSVLTGYLSGPHLRTWIGRIGVSPGLYPSLFMITVNVVMQFIVKDSEMAPANNIKLLFVFLAWFLSSWAGVGLGSFIGMLTKLDRTVNPREQE
jgi:hypothetical protein